MVLLGSTSALLFCSARKLATNVTSSSSPPPTPLAILSSTASATSSTPHNPNTPTPFTAALSINFAPARGTALRGSRRLHHSSEGLEILTFYRPTYVSATLSSRPRSVARGHEKG